MSEKKKKKKKQKQNKTERKEKGERRKKKRGEKAGALHNPLKNQTLNLTQPWLPLSSLLPSLLQLDVAPSLAIISLLLLLPPPLLLLTSLCLPGLFVSSRLFSLSVSSSILQQLCLIQVSYHHCSLTVCPVFPHFSFQSSFIIHPLDHSSTHSFIQSSTYSFIHLFNPLSIHPSYLISTFFFL